MDLSYMYGGHYGKRIWELDFLRGFCIILMIVDHILYDLAYIFWYKWFESGEGTGLFFTLAQFARTSYYPLALRNSIWWIAVFLFVFICGISCSFSHSNLKRGLKLAAVALVLSLLTYGADSYLGQVNQFTIRFGILHMLAASILILNLFKKMNKVLIISLAVLIIISGIYFINNPLDTGLVLLGPIIKTRSAFYSADYFTLMPWFGFFLLGAVFGPEIYPNKRSLLQKAGPYSWQRPILFVGRHSLVFYLVHQPAIYGILTCIAVLNPNLR